MDNPAASTSSLQPWSSLENQQSSIGPASLDWRLGKPTMAHSLSQHLCEGTLLLPSSHSTTLMKFRKSILRFVLFSSTRIRLLHRQSTRLPRRSSKPHRIRQSTSLLQSQEIDNSDQSLTCVGSNSSILFDRRSRLASLRSTRNRPTGRPITITSPQRRNPTRIRLFGPASLGARISLHLIPQRQRHDSQFSCCIGADADERIS